MATIAAAYLVPLANWAQAALLSIALGAVAGFASRGLVERSFEPADAPLAAKQKVVVMFAFARLVLAIALILFGAISYPGLLAAVLIGFGGYLAGTTAATPVSARQLDAG